MMYSPNTEERLVLAKCEAYRAEAERRRLELSAKKDSSLRKGLALRLHNLAGWLEPATVPAHTYLNPTQLKGRL